MVKTLAQTLIVALLALAMFSAAPAMAACGNGPGLGGCPPVGWAKTVSAAQAAAQEKHEAYAIYFCPPESAATAGEGSAVLAAARPVNKNKIVTVFDSPAVAYELRKAGVLQLAKVIANERNADLMKQYGAGPNTLVICASTGDKLMAFQGDACKQNTICSSLKTFSSFYASWILNNKKRS
jgi:hypothetical protein